MQDKDRIAADAPGHLGPDADLCDVAFDFDVRPVLYAFGIGDRRVYPGLVFRVECVQPRVVLIGGVRELRRVPGD